MPFLNSNRKDIKVIFKNNPILPNDYKNIISLISKRKLVPLIDSIFEAQDIKKAQHRLSNHGKKGRVLVKMNFN